MFQLNVRFRRESDDAPARAGPLFSGLRRRLARWRSTADVHLWFLRKPPGLRVRCGGPGFGPVALADLQGLLDDEIAAGRVESWGPSVYEPETWRVGGVEGHAAASAWLSADASAQLDACYPDGDRAPRLSADVVALAILSNLVERGTSSPAEVWDVWAGLQWAYSGERPVEPSTPPPDASLSPSGIHRLAAPHERAILDRVAQASHAYVAAIDGLWERNRLLGGRRALLGALAAFHFNVWCLDRAAIVGLCRTMVRETHPACAFMHDGGALAREGTG